MAFQIKRRSVARQLGKLVRKQLDLAIVNLDNGAVSNAGIHDARTHIKKARSIVKLLKEALDDKYGAGNNTLQSAGQSLAQVRDLEAMVETVAELGRRYPDVISQAVAQQIVAGLHSHPDDDSLHVNKVAHEAAAMLGRARNTLPNHIEEAGDFFYVRAGMAAVYQRSQAALQDLTDASDSASFHKWRKRVKEHWYHVRLFEALHPAAQARAASLKVLEQELGDGHNLSLLSATLLKDRRHFGDPSSIDRVLEIIQKRQQPLRTSALARGRDLFAAKPRTIAATADEWRRGKR